MSTTLDPKSLHRLRTAAGWAGVDLPESLFKAPGTAPTDVLRSAFENGSIHAARVVEEMEFRDVVKTLSQCARDNVFVGANEVNLGLVLRMYLGTTALELLDKVDPGADADLVRVLGYQVRADALSGKTGPRTRGQVFDALLGKVKAEDLLEILADVPASSHYRGAFTRGEFLTADQTAQLVAELPTSITTGALLGRFIDPLTTASLVRFGGHKGAILAQRAGEVDSATWASLLEALTPAEVLATAESRLNLGSAYSAPSLWPAILEYLAVLDADGLLAPALTTTMSPGLKEALLHGLELSWQSRLAVIDASLLRSWLRGRYVNNRPTKEAVAGWARHHDAAEVDLSEVTDLELRPVLALNLRGGAIHLKELLSSDERLNEVSAWLPAVQGLFKSEARLYARLITASGSAPFADPALSLAEATLVYWSRWNEAARRTSR